MFSKAKAIRDSRVILVNEWSEFIPALNSKCMPVIAWCEEVACEDDIKDRSAVRPAGEVVDDKAPSAGAKVSSFDTTSFD